MKSVLAIFSPPCATGQPERIPNPKEADRLAMAVLLCVDVERTHPGVETSDVLEPLLSPLLDTLSRISTNIYLPVRKSDKSLQLLLRLFQLGRASNCQLAGEEQGLCFYLWNLLLPVPVKSYNAQNSLSMKLLWPSWLCLVEAWPSGTVLILTAKCDLV